jgi:hypothetical protein
MDAENLLDFFGEGTYASPISSRYSLYRDREVVQGLERGVGFY